MAHNHLRVTYVQVPAHDSSSHRIEESAIPWTSQESTWSLTHCRNVGENTEEKYGDAIVNFTRAAHGRVQGAGMALSFALQPHGQLATRMHTYFAKDGLHLIRHGMFAAVTALCDVTVCGTR